MAVVPLTSIPGNVSLTDANTANQDRLASLSRTSSLPPEKIRSSGGGPRRLNAERSVAAETPQTLTASRSFDRNSSADASSLRASRRDTAAARFTPRGEVALSFEANSGATKTGAAATTSGRGSSRTQVAQTATPVTTPTNTAGAGTASTAASAKQVLAAFDALLRQALGPKIQLPANMSHDKRIKTTAKAMKLLSPTQQVAFLKQAESIGKSLGLNFGLNKSGAAGKQVPLNDGVAAKLSGGASDEYRKVVSELPKAPSAAPASPAAATSTDGTPTATQTPITPADAATATPDAQSFRALDLQSALEAVGKMEGKDIATLVESWAQGGQTVSKAQFEAGNPALAAAYFADGKAAVSVATLTQVLTNLTGKQTTAPTKTTVTPTTSTQK